MANKIRFHNRYAFVNNNFGRTKSNAVSSKDTN